MLDFLLSRPMPRETQIKLRIYNNDTGKHEKTPH